MKNTTEVVLCCCGIKNTSEQEQEGKRASFACWRRVKEKTLNKQKAKKCFMTFSFCGCRDENNKIKASSAFS